MKYWHIVIDWKERTYSVCDGVPAIEETHGISADTLNTHLSRNKKNYDKNGKMVLRAMKKNKVYKMDEDLDKQNE